MSRQIFRIAATAIFILCATLSACAGEPGLAIHEIKRGRDYGDVMIVHGIVASSVESILVVDEHCSTSLFGLSITNDVKEQPKVQKLLGIIKPVWVHKGEKIAFASLRVKPIYARNRQSILKLELMDVLSVRLAPADSLGGAPYVDANCD